ncbi:hypothetical protein QCA50_005968 [Cerrena zonata]|uniref:Uncharacterized protein n=1 Tax=Cerrena zonata TaxID=2478898 RepID=A0AAW0GD57_9APHY
MTPPIPTLSLSEAGSPILARTALQAEGVEILELCTLDSVFRLYPWFDFEDSAQDMVPFPALREVVWNPKPTTRTSDIRLIHNTLQKRHARGYTLPKLRIRMPQKPVLVLENSGSLESALTELRTVVNDLESD